MADIKIGDIAVYEDDDGKAVWEFEGKVQSDIPLDTDAQDFAGAINELKKLSEAGGGEDDLEPNYINDPDWEIFKNLPEPAPNQVIWGVRIIDTSYRQAGSYYNYIPQENSDGYQVDFDSQVRCHISITHNRIHRPLDPDSDFSDPNNWYLCSYHIDWGDGTSSSHAGGIFPEVSPGFVGNGGWDGGANTSLSHLYDAVGLYIVTLTVEEPDWKWFLDNNVISDNDNGSKYYAKAPQCVFAKIGGGFKNVGEDKNDFPLLANAGMIATRKFIQTPTIRFRYGNYSLSTGAYTLKYIKSTMEDLTELERVQFRDCYSLEKIEGVDFSLIKSIAASTFQSCATLKELRFENCTSVASAAFRQCISLRKIFLPNCTSIDDLAFCYCNSLVEIDLPNCTSIGNNAFQYCTNLKKINAPKCQKIGDYCFSQCNSLKEIDLPSLTSAGSNSFPSGNASQITKIVLPVIQSINFSMRSCYCLLEVNCPNAASIVDSAFQQCRALHTVIVADGCTFGINCFNECFSLRPRPDGSIN